MSAYLVDDNHVIQLAAFVCNADQSNLDHLRRHHAHGMRGDRNNPVEQEKLATHLANVLLAENYRSLRARYSDDDEAHSVIVTLGEVMRADQIPPVNILHSLACYEYQACESSDWTETDAFKLCDAIRLAAIKKLPGYDDAPWGAPFEFEHPATPVVSLLSMMR